MLRLSSLDFAFRRGCSKSISGSTPEPDEDVEEEEEEEEDDDDVAGSCLSSA